MLQNFVDGRFVDVDATILILVLNLATGKVIATCPDTPCKDLDYAVAAAKRAQPGRERLPGIRRAAHLHALADAIRGRREEIARVISLERGKLLSLAVVEVEFTVNYIDHMAEWARRIEGEIIPSDCPDETILLFRRTMGIVAGILPWDFPFFLFTRKIAPALVTGNTIDQAKRGKAAQRRSLCRHHRAQRPTARRGQRCLWPRHLRWDGAFEPPGCCHDLVYRHRTGRRGDHD